MAWIRTQELLAKLHPFIKVKPPSNRWRRKAFDLSHDDRFDIGIMACIGLNMVVMGMTYFGQSDAYTLFLEVVNYFFALVFTIEAIIKLSGLGKAYFFDAWNVRVFPHALTCIRNATHSLCSGRLHNSTTLWSRHFIVGVDSRGPHHSHCPRLNLLFPRHPLCFLRSACADLRLLDRSWYKPRADRSVVLHGRRQFQLFLRHHRD